MRFRTTLASTAMLSTAALLAAGCGGSGGTSSGSSTGSGGAGGTSAQRNYGGKTVEIWSSLDQPVINGLSAKLDPEAAKLGITVKWSKVDNINQVIISRVQAGDPPDIALLPQPGIIQQLGTQGKLTPLDKVLNVSQLQNSMTAGTLDVAKANGHLYGLLVSMNVKGLVWYPKPAFTQAGYQIPKTIDQLNALSAKIKSQGKTPWCLGIESGAATGWTATDWLEINMLKYYGVNTYQDWIDHKVKFDSPQVKKAADEFAKLAFTPGYVLGGRNSIASNNFGTAGNAMFKNPPGCYMYMQGSFITGFFPQSVQKNLASQVGVFGYPPAAVGGPNPIEGGGDTASIYKDSPAAEEVMRLLSQTSVGTVAASNGSTFISPHKDFPLADYSQPTTRDVAQIAYSATGFAFDASDAMPPAVGSGSEWKQLTNWVDGQESLSQALQNIDASWPTTG